MRPEPRQSVPPASKWLDRTRENEPINGPCIPWRICPISIWAISGVPRLDHLLGKRVLGFLSWHLRRKAVHQGAVLAALVADLHQSRPDHTAVTGDLVNISLPEEFRRAAAWLASLGPPADVSVIPGNHDAYVPIAWDRSLALWDSYMTGDADQDTPDPSEHFPYLRRRGPLALIGLSTAAPMPAHMAAGRLGAAQLARFDALLAETGAEGLCRVVLIHHPPVSSARLSP